MYKVMGEEGQEKDFLTDPEEEISIEKTWNVTMGIKLEAILIREISQDLHCRISCEI